MSEYPEEFLNGPTLPPPSGEPNFEAEPPLQAVSYATAILCLTVGTIFFAVRVAVRWRFWRTPALVDIFSVLFYPLYVFYFYWLFRLIGDGQFFVHLYDIRIRDASRFFYIQFRGTNTWLAAMGLLKSSVFLEWIRILCPGRQRDYFFWSCWALIIINLLFYGSLLIAYNLACQPYARNWDKLVPGTCVNVNATDASAGIINLMTDVIALFLPMRIIWQLNMPTSKKWSVTAVFGVGVLACVAASLRLAASVRFYNSADATFTFSANSLWGTAEITCGLIILGAPSVPKLLQSAGVAASWRTRKATKPSSASDSWARATANSTQPHASRLYRRMEDEDAVALTNMKADGEGAASVEQLHYKENPSDGILRTTDFTRTEDYPATGADVHKDKRHNAWDDSRDGKIGTAA